MKWVSVTLLAGALVFSTGAFAQQDGPPGQHGDSQGPHDHQGQQDAHNGEGGGPRGGGGPGGPGGPGDPGDHRDYRVHHVAPDRFRGDDRVVGDYGRYHLRRPPHGYHWVRGDNGDFLLVAAATGLVASIIAESVQ